MWRRYSSESSVRITIYILAGTSQSIAYIYGLLAHHLLPSFEDYAYFSCIETNLIHLIRLLSYQAFTMRFFATLLFMPILGAIAMPALFVPRDDEPLSSAGVCKDEHTCLSNGKEYSCKVFVSYYYQFDCSVCACY